MIDSYLLFNELKSHNVNFFTGVPDSILKNFCSYISDKTSENEHIIAANEGAAIAIAAGYHIATGNIPLVYMQNSGLGNSVNPLLSIADKEVYSLPMILMIGWRGEPGFKDEPQHIKQGRIQNNMLVSMEIPYRILDSKTSDLSTFINEIIYLVQKEQAPVAIVVRKDTFNSYKLKNEDTFMFEMNRENAIEQILNNIPKDTIIVSTTGKLSREVFEYRFKNKQGHQYDFLTVGGMGHCSQIALGIALNTSKKVICIDGDGALIMHMGSLGIIGKNAPSNFIHILINNGAHDSVGGQPTIGFYINFPDIALACGYKKAFSISSVIKLKEISSNIINENGPVFLEVKVKKGSRSDLGRPTKSPIENKFELMNFLKGGK